MDSTSIVDSFIYLRQIEKSGEGFYNSPQGIISQIDSTIPRRGFYDSPQGILSQIDSTIPRRGFYRRYTMRVCQDSDLLLIYLRSTIKLSIVDIYAGVLYIVDRRSQIVDRFLSQIVVDSCYLRFPSYLSTIELSTIDRVLFLSQIVPIYDKEELSTITLHIYLRQIIYRRQIGKKEI